MQKGGAVSKDTCRWDKQTKGWRALTANVARTGVWNFTSVRKATLSSLASSVLIRQNDFCRSRFNRFNAPRRVHVHWGTWQHGKSFISTVPLGVANLPHNDYYICSGPFLWIPDSGQHSMPPTNHLWGVLLVHTLYLTSSFLLRLVPLHNSATTSPLLHSIKPIICATSVLSLATLWALPYFGRLLLHAKCACVLTLNWLRSPGSVPVIYRQNGSRHITG